MALLKRKKRKKDEEDYEEDEEEPRKRKKKLTKKSHRKKKEPPKPWGRKERILVLAILLATVGTSAILYLSSRAWKLPGLPRLTFPSINLPFSGEETIVIEGENTQDLQKKSEEIVSVFAEETKSLTGLYGLYVVDLETGYSFGVNETSEFEPASLNKLPVMVGMYQEYEKGNIDLDATYVLKNEDKLSGSGTLSSKPEGYELTYRGILELMGKQSDNTAFNIARTYLGEEKIKDIINEIGMTQTSLEENTTTPEDIAIFFKKLYVGDLINKKDKEELLGNLTDTVYEQWIAKDIPEGVVVSHKYGREVNVVNDAGIVFAERPYVVVLLSRGVITKEADLAIPEISKLIYDINSN